MKSIPLWLQENQNKSQLNLEDFFLTKKEYPKLYEKALKLHEKSKEDPNAKKFPGPIEQLSPVGLAVLSYIQSTKDHDPAQPIIASTIVSLRKIVSLVSDSPAGTQVTVIFQPTEIDGPLSAMFSSVHKTILKLEKEEEKLIMTHMDSTANNSYQFFPFFQIFYFESKLNPSLNYVFNFVKIQDPIEKGRQFDGYQCGTFAFRDAIRLNRDIESTIKFSQQPENIQEYEIKDFNVTLYSYKLPSEYLISMQSRTKADKIIEDQSRANAIVTRRGRNLKESYEKYFSKEGGYAHYFSQKNYNRVSNFISENSAQTVLEVVKQYDASHITQEILATTYNISHRKKLAEERNRKNLAFVPEKILQQTGEVQEVIKTEEDFRNAIFHANEEDLVKIIKNHKNDILNSEGKIIDKESLVNDISLVLNNPNLIFIQPMAGLFTRNYGIREKVLALCEAKKVSAGTKLPLVKEMGEKEAQKQEEVGEKAQEQAEEQEEKRKGEEERKQEEARQRKETHQPLSQELSQKELLKETEEKVEKIISKNINISEYPGEVEQSKSGEEYTIGDLHSNPIKLLYFLTRQGIAVIDQRYFNNLVEIYNTYDFLDLEKKAKSQVEEFKKILTEHIKFNTDALVRLIGDETADRGKNDIFILLIEKALLDAGVKLEVLISNHGFEFIQAYEKNVYQSEALNGGFSKKNLFDFAEKESLDSLDKVSSLLQARSLIGLETSLENDHLSKDEIKVLIENHKKNLKLIGYTLSENEITIYSHAAIDISVLKAAADKLGVEFDATAHVKLAQSIDRINAGIKKYVNNNTLHTLCDERHLNSGVSKEYPIECILWNRQYASLSREKSFNGYQVNYVHGHDDKDADSENVFCLDSPLGKPGKDQGEYSILRSISYQSELKFQDILKRIFPNENDWSYIEAYKFLEKHSITNETISENIANFIISFEAENALKKENFESLMQALSEVKNEHVYDAIIGVLNKISVDICVKYKNNIDNLALKVEEKVVIGDDFVFPFENEFERYKGLLNVYQLTKGNLMRNRSNNYYGIEFPGSTRHMEETIYELPFFINLLMLTNKVNKEDGYIDIAFNKPIYPKEIHQREKIELKRGIKLSEKYFPYKMARKIAKGDTGDTVYMATDGKKMLYLRAGKMGYDKKDIENNSLLASKIASFVSKKHFSSERLLDTKVVGSRKLPGYVYAAADQRSRDARKDFIEEKKGVIKGTGIVDEVLNFVCEWDPNVENYGFSSLEFEKPDNYICKIDFDGCSFDEMESDRSYEYDILTGRNGLYHNLPHVKSDKGYIHEKLITRLKLSILSRMLVDGMIGKTTYEGHEKDAVINEVEKRTNIALDFFVKNEHAKTFLLENKNVLAELLLETESYVRSHFDKSEQDKIIESVHQRVIVVKQRLDEKFLEREDFALKQDQTRQGSGTKRPQSLSPQESLQKKELVALRNAFSDILNEDDIAENLKNLYQQKRTEEGWRRYAQSLNIRVGHIKEIRDEQLRELTHVFEKIKDNSTTSAKDKKKILYGLFSKIMQDIEKNEPGNVFRSRLYILCTEWRDRLELHSVDAGMMIEKYEEWNSKPSSGGPSPGLKS